LPERLPERLGILFYHERWAKKSAQPLDESGGRIKPFSCMFF